MIDNVEIIERPEPEAVSREEANGIWTQVDATRIAVQSQTQDIGDLKEGVAALLADMRWVRAGIFLLLAWQIGSAVYSAAPAQAMIASVWP